MSSTQDQAFVIRASKGDVEAFRLLVQEHSGLVYRVALRILGVEDAQDASQDELIILVVVLITWGFGTASIVLN